MATIIPITDLSAPELAVYTQLTHAQLRSQRHPEQGIFIAESAKVIACALRAGCQPISFLMEERQIPAFLSQVGPVDDCVPLYTADRPVLASLTGYELTRGVLCAMRRPQLPTPRELCRNARRVVVLEHITDATNIGALFRSAAALGMDAILVTPTCCDPLYRRAVRVSMGAVFQIPWAWLSGEDFLWPQTGIPALQQMGFHCAAMALTDQSISIDDPALARADKLAIVLGSEGSGLCDATIALCDYTARIPMAHGVDSLNVAAAGAVMFWQLRCRDERVI